MCIPGKDIIDFIIRHKENEDLEKRLIEVEKRLAEKNKPNLGIKKAGIFMPGLEKQESGVFTNRRFATSHCRNNAIGES